jgi:hypothetical protein
MQPHTLRKQHTTGSCFGNQPMLHMQAHTAGALVHQTPVACTGSTQMGRSLHVIPLPWHPLLPLAPAFSWSSRVPQDVSDAVQELRQVPNLLAACEAGGNAAQACQVLRRDL